MFELFAVGESLSAEDVSEDGNNDVIGVILGVLDHGVSEEEFNSDILEAVAGQKEGNTVPFNDISENRLRLVGVALVEHVLSFFHKSEEFNLFLEIFDLDKMMLTVLSSSSFSSISGLIKSKTLATQSSSLARAWNFSIGPAKRQTRRQAKMIVFMFKIKWIQ